jgi:rhodanese-related sulfurtransferase
MSDDADFAVDPGAWEMAEEADAEVETVTVEDLDAERDDPDTVVLDVRDIREVWIEGSIPDAQHAPRGMLEFWADPGTEYYKDFFHPENRYVLYCNAGGRSAMAADRLREMGYPDVAHLEGGFTAWQEADVEMVDVPQKDYESR